MSRPLSSCTQAQHLCRVCRHAAVSPAVRCSTALPVPCSAQRSRGLLDARQQQAAQTIRTAAKAAATEAPSASWEDDIAKDDHMGPAFRATLAMLEWPRLCEHVAAFASTSIGKAAVKVKFCRCVILREFTGSCMAQCNISNALLNAAHLYIGRCLFNNRYLA